MTTEVHGKVYSFQANSAGNWLGVKVDGGKVVRFKSDRSDWKLDQPVVIRVEPVSEQPSDNPLDLLKGVDIDD